MYNEKNLGHWKICLITYILLLYSETYLIIIEYSFNIFSLLEKIFSHDETDAENHSKMFCQVTWIFD